MYKPVIRISKWGFLASGLFLLLAAAVFGWIIYSASTNPGDSGESGILLLPFAMPWIMLIPQNWLAPITGFGLIGLNALILYAIFGGLRLAK
jgi:hypothetical protein